MSDEEYIAFLTSGPDGWDRETAEEFMEVSGPYFSRWNLSERLARHFSALAAGRKAACEEILRRYDSQAKARKGAA